MITIKTLLEKLAYEGGKIVSSNYLTADAIQSAREQERMYVDENGYGFIWMRDAITPEMKQ